MIEKISVVAESVKATTVRRNFRWATLSELMPSVSVLVSLLQRLYCIEPNNNKSMVVSAFPMFYDEPIWHTECHLNTSLQKTFKTI